MAGPILPDMYVWHNLPSNITSQELERMLYYKGQLWRADLQDILEGGKR